MTTSYAAHIALFDLDHTLLPIDSDFTWTTFTNAMGWTDAEQSRIANEAFYQQYKAGRLDMAEYVRFVTRAMRPFTPEQLLAAQEQYGREYIAPHIRQPALDLLAQHRAAGHTLVLTTATVCYIARPIGQQLGFADEHIITTQLHYTEQGCITGESVGQFNLREGKVHNFERWLQARGWDWGDVHITFYSDSINDLPLLEKANTPVATNPDDQLRQIATERNWHIMDLFQKI
ncbi:MAG: HAD family hydrolase [Brachymonas sp.]|nr:HAD family hydrolase [Brachymonas sp.]MBP6138086.1 HAD family hydrolase [Brachymonas sp.]MBP6966080.1 HAD family hydrolase [Brachymonas sp.]MBP7246984.1 HAD family hydrolase [Brachymonas sp.]MBP7743652.1 HAD family hydrolase [Brachymonas sp.]